VTAGDNRTDTGMGLGLPIAALLVEAMNGRLWYESRFPTGSRFCFTVPMVTKADSTIEPIAARSN
jgi:signal transduction histidine kinase